MKNAPLTRTIIVMTRLLSIALVTLFAVSIASSQEVPKVNGSLVSQAPCRFASFEQESAFTKRFYSIDEFENAKNSRSVDCFRIHYMSDRLMVVGFIVKPEREQARQRILVTTATGDLVIDAQEIEWIEADDYYAAIHRRQERYLIRESLASLEHRLDRNRFVRTHRSAIVNLDRVKAVHRERGETVLVLEGGTKIPVSRRRRARVSQLLHLHVK